MQHEEQAILGAHKAVGSPYSTQLPEDKKETNKKKPNNLNNT